MDEQEYEFRAVSGRITTIEYVAPYVVAACCNELRFYDLRGNGRRALTRCAIFSPAHTVHGLRVLASPTAADADRLFCVFGGCQLTVAQLAQADHPTVRHVTRVFTLTGWIFDVLAIRDSRSSLIPLLAVALGSNSVCLFDCDRGSPIRTFHHPETCTLFSAKLFSSRLTCEQKPVELHRPVELNELVCLSGTQFGSVFLWQPADSHGAQRCVLEGVRGGIYDIETHIRCLTLENTHTHKLYVYAVSENRALNVFESSALKDDLLHVTATNLRHVAASFGHAARVWRVRKLPSAFTSSPSAADTKRYLATVGEDSRLLVWSIDDEANLTPHRSWQLPTGTGVWSLTLAGERQLCNAGPLWLITGGADGSLWRVELHSALAHQTHSVESFCLPPTSTPSGSHSNKNDFIRSLCMLFGRAVVLCSDTGLIALVDMDETRQGDTQRIRVIDIDPRFRGYSTASHSDSQSLSSVTAELTSQRCLVAIGSACGFVRVLSVSQACGRLHVDPLMGICVAAEKVMSLNWKQLGEEQLLFVSTLSGIVYCLNVGDQLVVRFRLKIPQQARFRFQTAVELVLDQSGHLHIVTGDRSSYVHYYVLDYYRGYTDTNVLIPLCSFKAHSITSVRHIVRLNDCSRCAKNRVMLLSAGCDGRLCEFALDCAKRTLVLQGEHRPLRERDAHADWLERIVQLEVHGRSSLLLVAFRADRCQLHLFELQSARAVMVTEFDCGGAHREFSMNVASCGDNAVNLAFAYVHRRKLSVVRRVVVPELQMVSDACTHGGVQVWDALELPLPSRPNDNGCCVVALACEDGVIRIVGLVTAPCTGDAGVLSVDLCAIPGHSSAVKCLELASMVESEDADNDEVRFVLLSGGAKAELRVHVVRIDVCQLRRLLQPRAAVAAPACPSWRHVVSFALKACFLLLQQPNAAGQSNARRRDPSATESRIMCLVSFSAQRRDASTPTRCVSMQSRGAHMHDDDDAICVVAGTSDSRLCMLSLSHDRLRLCTCVKRQRHCVTCIKHVRCSGKDLLLSTSTNGSLAVWLADGDELLLRFDKLLFPSCVYSFDLLHPGPGTHTCCMLTVTAGCDDGLPHVAVLRAADASSDVFELLDRTSTPHTAGHVCALTSVALCARDLPRLLCAAGDMHLSDWHLHAPNATLTHGSEYAIGVPDVQRLRVLSGLCVILVGDGLGLMMRPRSNPTQS